MRLGVSEFTRTPNGANWMASERVRLSTPPFAAEYAVASARPRWPDVEAMLMILPPRPWSRICRPAYLHVRNTLLSVTSMMRSHSSSGRSSAGVWSVIAALFTRMSTPPNASTVALTMCCTSSLDDTSAWTAMAQPGWSALMASATACAASSRTSTSATFAPSPTK